MTSTHPALLVVDVQVDFCPGGSLAVKNGSDVVPRLNRVIKAFERRSLPIFFTRDWHPANHISFKSRGGIWPPHCVQGTSGAEFHSGLLVPGNATIVSKGDKPSMEAYSGFQGTDLETRLKRLGIDKVFVGGLATDYCVKETTLDARRTGLAVEVLKDCVRPVDIKPGDGARALAEMRRAGAKLTTSSAVIHQLAGRQP